MPKPDVSEGVTREKKGKKTAEDSQQIA